MRAKKLVLVNNGALFLFCALSSTFISGTLTIVRIKSAPLKPVMYTNLRIPHQVLPHRASSSFQPVMHTVGKVK